MGIDRAVAEDLPFISFIWHPWSLARFDPDLKMLKMTFAYVAELGLQATTYAEEWERIKLASSVEVAS